MTEINTTDAYEYVETQLKQETQQAKAALCDLSDSPYRDALYAITELSVGDVFCHKA